MFPDWLAAKMAEKNLTEKMLADAVGVTQQAVSGWLKGKRRPGLPSARRLAKEFGVQTDELLDLLDASPSPIEESERDAEVAQIRSEMARLAARVDRLSRPQPRARRSS